MIEIFDKEARLDKSVSEPKELLSGNDKGERLAATLDRLTKTPEIDEMRCAGGSR